tara:strand:+ start:141 stop:914 length:774 start_codon:yes stop_codon:yes gene_type:complete
MDKIEQIAKYMLDQHQNKMPFQNLPTSLKPSDINEAYKAQSIFHKVSGRGVLGGYKIALASKIQQELCGIDHPIAGGIFAKEIKSSPSTFELKKYHGLGLEFEIAVTLSKELNLEMGMFDQNNIKQYIKCLSPAFEMIIDRDADYSNIDALTMIADNAWCSGIVIGDALPNWQDLELTTLTSKLYWNNETPQDAMINDANPLVSLSWVANLLVAQGKTIPAESVIITGSVIKTRAPLIGDKIIYDVGGLSKVEINII